MPSSTQRQPSLRGANPKFSSHIGSNQANGTYISTTSISSAGFLIPPLRHKSAAHISPATGLTCSRPANAVGSLRFDVACTHAFGPACLSARSSLINTKAIAPSLDGHVSIKRIGSHNIGVSSAFSSVQSGSCKCAYGFLHALVRSFTATIAPICDGAPERAM